MSISISNPGGGGGGGASLTNTAPVDDGASAAVGVSTAAARGDHRHKLPNIVGVIALNSGDSVPGGTPANTWVIDIPV